MHRRACALENGWRCFRYKDIDNILKSEHECTQLGLPRTMTVHCSLSLTHLKIAHKVDSSGLCLVVYAVSM
jgi:hypothetical protein